MNFMDTWHQLYAQHTDIVFWPSAYGGGMPIRAYAKLYHYAIVPTGWGDITDSSGRIAAGLSQEATGIFTASLDLDTTWFHTNFNSFDKILADYKGDIVQETLPGYCATDGNCSSTGDMLFESGFVVLSRTDAGYKKGVSVRALKDTYGLIDLATYQHQSRHAINMQRMTAAPGVEQWPYHTNGHPPVHDHNHDHADASRAAHVRSHTAAAHVRSHTAAADLRKVVGKGGSTDPEARVIVAQSAFVKAEGSRGRRGVE